MGSHHIISPQLIQIPLQAKICLSQKLEEKVITPRASKRKVFLHPSSTCVFKGIAFCLLETGFLIYTAHPEDVGTCTSRTSAARLTKRCAHFKNPTQPLCYYLIWIFIIIPENWYFFSILPAKPEIKK